MFGAESINASIRRGLAGDPQQFHAVENGHELGTRVLESGQGASVTGAHVVVDSREPEIFGVGDTQPAGGRLGQAQAVSIPQVGAGEHGHEQPGVAH